MRFLILVLGPVLYAAQPCDMAPTHKRYAVIVANGKYANLPSASTAVGDSQVMKRALEGAGFAVTSVENATMPDLFDKDQKGFLERVQPGDIVFFYYAGHVVQGPNEDSFLLPVNFDPSMSVNDQVFSLKRFLEDLDERKPGVTVVMVEGPHPVGRPIPGVTRAGLIAPDLRGMGKILFAMSAQKGEMVAASPEVVIDLFTKAVGRRLAIPGLTLTEVFEQARQDVISETHQHQLPEVQQIAPGGFCFIPPITKVEPQLPPVVKPILVVETVPNNRKDHAEYVRILPGTFKMGCVPNDSKCKVEEGPQHKVTLTNGFWMGRTEVEVRPFLRYWMDTAKKKRFPRQAPLDYRGWVRDNLPMVRVTWEEASDYCKWVGGRLPTEAEWEYAARAGSSDEIYPLNSQNSRDRANFEGTKGNDTFPGVAPVRSFDRNGFNLYDMSGNVWEWVSDWYEANYYQVSPAVDPKGPAAGKEHLVRGGSFESKWQEHLRLSFRLPQTGENFKTGFRCVLDDTPATRQLLGVH